MAPLPWLTATFFSLALPATLYLLYKHRRAGLLAWLHLFTFCLVRLAGNIMIINAAADTAYSITDVPAVNSLGMAWLLLAGVGVLFEARKARNLDRRPWLEWLFVVVYHLVASVALYLLVTGINQVLNGNPEVISWTTQSSTYLKPAMALFFVCWAFLTAGVLYSLRLPGNAVRPAAFNHGTKLLYATLYTLPFLLCKLIYAALAYFLTNARFATSDAMRAALDFVPEVVATMVLLWVGVATREMWVVKGTVRSRGGASQVTEAEAEAEAAMESQNQGKWYALEDVPERFEGMKE